MSRIAAVLVLIGPVLLSPFVRPAFGTPLDDAAVAYLRCDYAEALRLYRPLAERGDPVAQLNLGELHYHGRGVPQAYPEAMEWYRKAANQGDAEAQFRLGTMFNMGQGGPQDYTEAAYWYERAAAQGHGDAQVSLAVMYLTGEGVPYDFVLSHMWYGLAAAGHPDARKRDIAAMNRDLVTSYMTDAQVAEAERMAREWVPAKER